MDVDCVILQCQSKYQDGEITIQALSMKKSKEEIESTRSQKLELSNTHKDFNFKVRDKELLYIRVRILIQLNS